MKSLRRLRQEEDGTAVTEFVMFLPIWIMTFVAILSLARVGMMATNVQLLAHQEVWSKAIPLTAVNALSLDSPGDGNAHASLRLGHLAAAGGYLDAAGTGHVQQLNDTLEAASSGVSAVEGHYAESYDRSLLPTTLAFHADNINATMSPEDVLGMDDTDRYPHRLLNDTLTDISFGNGVIPAVIGAINAAGIFHHLGAGIQYGTVFAEETDSKPLFGQWSTVSTGFQIDVLVPPRPLTDNDARYTPPALAFATFKGDERYEKYLEWGKNTWGGDGGDEFKYDGPTDEEGLRNQHEDDAEDAGEACEDERQAAQDAAQAQWEANGNEGNAPPVSFDMGECARRNGG